jgi:hypothetical protein
MVAEGVFSTGRTGSYCTVEDVLKVLAVYDLSAYANAEGIEARIRELLPGTREAVDQYAGRDFFRHEETTVTVDGSGTDLLQLFEAGARPPVSVQTVTVGGQVLGSEEWCAYGSAGTVRLTREASLARFPAGVQNVTVALSWGYEAIPEVVIQAQAKITAAEMLSEAGAEAGEVTSTRIGDYAVSYGREGRYAGVIARLCEEAREALAAFRVVRMLAV